MTTNLILFDRPDVWKNMLPITFTRPISDIRAGITTLRQKWEQALGVASSSTLTEPYLREKFPILEQPENIFVASDIIADASVAAEILALRSGEALADGKTVLAARCSLSQFQSAELEIKEMESKPRRIGFLYDIFLNNGDLIRRDFALLDHADTRPLSPTNTVIGPTHDATGKPLIHIAPTARVEGAFINTTGGPVFVDDNAEVMEGSCLRGPVAVCAHSVVNMGTKIYADTTIGPWSKVGGELNNVVIIGYSNKAHDGFLGNAVIGEWCNLGAGCVASNLKNDYTPIKLWNYPAHRFLKTGLQFCGLIMADHSKAGINTMFNTATVVGVGVNIHGSGFPRNFVASFSEGGASGFTDVPLTKFFDTATRVMARRGQTLTDVDRDIFSTIHDIADNYK